MQGKLPPLLCHALLAFESIISINDMLDFSCKIRVDSAASLRSVRYLPQRLGVEIKIKSRERNEYSIENSA
jgi:hypothetical protein